MTTDAWLLAIWSKKQLCTLDIARGNIAMFEPNASSLAPLDHMQCYADESCHDSVLGYLDACAWPAAPPLSDCEAALASERLQKIGSSEQAPETELAQC